MESWQPLAGDASEVTAALGRAHRVLAGTGSWCASSGPSEPVLARRLVAISPGMGLVGRAEASLVRSRLGDDGASNAIRIRRSVAAVLSVNLVVPAGIASPCGAGGRGAGCRFVASGVLAFRESHARDSRPHAVTRCLLTGTGVGLTPRRSRPPPVARWYARMPTRRILLLLDDLLGIADPDVPLAPYHSGCGGGGR